MPGRLAIEIRISVNPPRSRLPRRFRSPEGSFVMFRNFSSPSAGKIYVIIALCFACSARGDVRDARARAEPRQAEADRATHLGDLALAIVKEEHAAAEKAGLPVDEAQKRAADRLGAAALRQRRLFLDQRHASAHGHASDQPELDGKDVDRLQGRQRQAALSSLCRRREEATATASSPTNASSPARQAAAEDVPRRRLRAVGLGRSAPASISTTSRPRPGQRPAGR